MSQTVVVVGQGYVGLPVAIRAVAMGFNVIGIDLDEKRIAQLHANRSYVEDISGEELAAAFSSGRFKATSSYDSFHDYDFAVITVPTPLRESLPDLTFVKSAAKSLAGRLKPGATVILESTTYPGTTEELLVPLLELGSGLKAGTDFFVGYSPERIDPGNREWGFVETPKVVSGVNQESLNRVQAFYEVMVRTTVPVSSPKEAELAKLLENTFRHVNIALVNELAIFAKQLNIDVWEAIDAAATKPFGFMKFTPGPGVGGHCLPVDPSYLSWEVRRKLGTSFRFIDLANEINDQMPEYVVGRIVGMLNEHCKPLNGSKILVVGVAYKADTGDIRQAPSLKILDSLDQMGAILAAVDSHVMHTNWPARVRPTSLTAEEIADADLVLVLTDHSDLDLEVLNESGNGLILDTRHVLTSTTVDFL